MLLSSLASALEGFTNVRQSDTLNLSLALFFAEVALFYVLAAALHHQPMGIHLAAVMACATVWQLMIYAGVSGEYYILVFGLVGLGLLIAYRFAVLDQLVNQPLAEALFQSANTLLSLAFVSSGLLAMTRLLAGQARWEFITLCLILTGISVLAVLLVRDINWRRWYVVTSVGEALLTFLGLTILGTLSPMQKLEVFCVCSGILLLVVGHLGWYREQDRESDLVTVSLFFGSVLVCLPLAIAALVDRGRDRFLILNELGFLMAGVLLLTTGFIFQLKATTLVGAATTALYFVSLLIFVPWSRLNAVATFITIGGGTLFALGLLLSIYRERLLTMPERIKKRQGLFRVLAWR
jgi:hypothetical protein